MAENIPSTVAETPVVYKRFSQADKISQGTNNAALSLNDYIPGQHVTGPNQNDIAATLAQLQAIPIGTATLSGNTYNVTISNYPSSATIYPGQKISVQFQNNAPTAEDTALNLSAFGKSLPMCARGIRMGRGSIKAGMVLNFIYWPDKWNADYDLVENVNGVLKYAESSSVYNKQSVDSALTKIITPATLIDSSFKSAGSEIFYTETAGVVHVWGTVKTEIQKSAYGNVCYLPAPSGNKTITSFLYNIAGDNQKLQIITDSNNRGRLQNTNQLSAGSAMKFDYTYATADAVTALNEL